MAEKNVRPSDVIPRYFSGGEWKARKVVKGQRASRTPGNKKGLVPPAIARYMARSNRSHKHPQYEWWSNKCDGGKIQWSGKA